MRAPLTLDRLKSLVSYSPETGEFHRLVKVGTADVGLVVSGLNGKGYYRIRIDGKSYLMHRLAWFYVHGVFPPSIMDHIDGVTTNNRIANLRPCTHMENIQNVSAKGRGKSGYRGVYFHKKTGRWEARIGCNYKVIALGYHDTAELARDAYLDWKRKNHAFTPEFTR